jgi:hypothetical protein
VIGVAAVTAPVVDLKEPVRFGDREFPLGMEFTIDRLLPRDEGVELAPLIPELHLSFPNARAWSTRLRRALVPLAPKDGRALERRIRRTAGPPDDARGSYSLPVTKRV